MTLVLLLLLQDFAQEIEKLGSESLEERAAAEDALVAAGEKAVPHLVKAFRACDDAEVAARIKSALRRIGGATLDYLERNPEKELQALCEEIYAERFKPYVPTERLEYISIEYGTPPAGDASKLVVRFEEGLGTPPHAWRFYTIRLAEDGLLFDRATLSDGEVKCHRATLPASAGRTALRLLLYASAMKVTRSRFSGGWGSSMQVLVGVQIQEEGRDLFRGAYWSSSGSNGQPKYVPLQVMSKILSDAMKDAKWEEREMPKEFRDDLLGRAAWYLSLGEEDKVDAGKAVFEKLKNLLEK